jgi:uncharacterized protein (DUF1684 family)
VKAGGSLALLDWRRRVAALYADVRAEPDPATAHERWCTVRADLLKSHAESPVPAPERGRYAGPVVAPYDPAFRFEATVDTGGVPARLEVPTGTDGEVPFDRLGQVHLAEVGDLDVWWLAGYGGGVFVPVKDALAGTGTYGGGRYVVDTAKGADLGGDPAAGTLVIDFNFAYNPSCAYDPAWACPLAPPGNVVAAPIPAGEMVR